MSHLLHVFPLISLHKLTPITVAYQWNAHDHFEQTIICISSFLGRLLGTGFVFNPQQVNKSESVCNKDYW